MNQKETSNQEAQAERDAWDEVLETPQSVAFLNQMSEQALQEMEQASDSLDDLEEM